MNNSRNIIKGWIARSERPLQKYNESLRQAVADWSGIVPADGRGGEDCGTEQEKLIEHN